MHDCKCGQIIGDDLEMCSACYEASQLVSWRKRAIEAEKKLTGVEEERDAVIGWVKVRYGDKAMDEARRLILALALTPPDSSLSGRTPESGVSGGVEFNEA